MEAPIVERLRKAVEEVRNSSEGYWYAKAHLDMMLEAADEIERLEQENYQLGLC